MYMPGLTLHFLEFETFGFPDRLEDEEDGNQRTHSVETVSTRQTDTSRCQHDRKGHRDREVGDPLRKAGDGETCAANLVREHLTKGDPHDRAP